MEVDNNNNNNHNNNGDNHKNNQYSYIPVWFEDHFNDQLMKDLFNN